MKNPFEMTPQMILETRETGRGKRLFPEIMIFFAVFVVAGMVESFPVGIGESIWLLSGGLNLSGASDFLMKGDVLGYFDYVITQVSAQPQWLMILSLFSTALLTVVVILFCRVLQKRRLSSLGMGLKGALKEYALGAVIGFVQISAAALICLAFGGLRFELGMPSLPIILLYFFGYAVQGMSEEVLCRGYFLPSVARKHKVWVAVLVSSLAFAALHLANPGFTPLAFLNIALCGAAFALYVLKRGNLWGACAMHSLWNFTMGNIYGISVSGQAMQEAPLRGILEPSMRWLNGGSFGLEGGIAVTVVELALIAFILFVLPARDVGAEAVKKAE